MADSASTLSYPHTSELVNSLIKRGAYAEFGNEDARSFSSLTGFGVLAATCDFRKHLHVDTHLAGEKGSLPGSYIMWGCECRGKAYSGTRIYWFSLDEFDINEFKMVTISLSID